MDIKSYNYPYTVKFGKDRYHELRSMIDWCSETIGPLFMHPDENLWTVDTVFGNSVFKFKEQKHANWFSLRWA